MDRRAFLRIAGVVGGASLAGSARAETPAANSTAGSVGVLIDLTRCVGCRSCELACADANGLPAPELDWATLNEVERPTSDRQLSVVNRYTTSRGAVFAKRQCMHCLEPACAAACPTKALLKTKEGPVIWRPDKCMGCRYCMISCPFDVPKFEYNSPVPKITKCQMCWDRLGDGETPACVQNCPAGALAFGPREELLATARERIHANPAKYVSHIYGEHEAGGTGGLYISPVPFEELRFRTDLGVVSFPEFTRDFLTAVPMVLVLWPAFLLALRRATGREDAVHPGDEPAEEHTP